MHARSRHRMEYQAHVETLAAAKVDQVDILQRRLDALLASMGQRSPEVQEARSSRLPRVGGQYVPTSEPGLEVVVGELPREQVVAAAPKLTHSEHMKQVWAAKKAKAAVGVA